MHDIKNTSSLSASQEILLLTRAHKLHSYIDSQGMSLPLRVLAYDTMHDLSPIGMALLDYDVHVVNSDPTLMKSLEPVTGSIGKLLTHDSYPLFELGKQSSQAFDVAIVNGALFTNLRSDAHLLEGCQQLAAALKQGGILIVKTADFDDTLKTKTKILKPEIKDDQAGRRINMIVRDWHGNGYEYTETHYNIEDHDSSPTVARRKYLRRAWRRAEITLALMRTGMTDVQLHSDEIYHSILIARKE